MKKFFTLLVAAALLAGAAFAYAAGPPAAASPATPPSVEDEVATLSDAVIALKKRVKAAEGELASLKKSQRKVNGRLGRVANEAADASRTASKAVREVSEIRSAIVALRAARGEEAAQTNVASPDPRRQGNLAAILRQAAELSAAQARLLSEAGRQLDP